MTQTTLANQTGGAVASFCIFLLTTNALLRKRRGKKRATVALARRIGVVLHRMWMDGTDFRFTRKDAAAA